MRYLGIDQSYSSTGICVAENGQLIHSTTYKTAKEDDIFQRAWNISEKLVAIIKEYGVDFVSIEGLAFGSANANATRDLAGLQYLIVCKIRIVLGIPVLITAPTALKKFATGAGKASKKEMISSLPPEIEETFRSQGFKLTTGLADLADAWHLAQFARASGCSS